ncbi:unnamed protein product [Coffea canephora]|uniref:CW-type domain-containing protein n=1 Tax=Coffea canephora TaxID=49390 RepID=A0A068TZU5_COFCA|nr:unnamed protein product [Coffea canephora]
MGDFCLKNELANEGDINCYVLLTKDHKPICRTQCFSPPSKMPTYWSISHIIRPEKAHIPHGLPCCSLYRASENSQQEIEWVRFLNFLQTYKKVAVGKLDSFEFYIIPPCEGSDLSHVRVLYKEERRNCLQDCLKQERLAGILSEQKNILLNAKPHRVVQSAKGCMQSRFESSLGEDAVSISNCIEDSISPEYKLSDADGCQAQYKVKVSSKPENVVDPHGSLGRNYVQVDPSYLKTLGQVHSSWIFGAIAEFVDNSRDAKATKLQISMEMVYYKPAGKDIPMLSIIDDGHGMTHQEIVRMISFGHKQPEADDPDHIGRFGIGFKTGAMRIGKDALVLTQAASSRSVAFLSQSLNDGKDNLEIPIVSYHRVGQFMEIDSNVQNEASAKNNLKAIREFSPFNKYLIGEKAGLFSERGTGTQIYIWNLDQWGSDYSLCLETGMIGGSSFHQGDILIHSKRVRSRPGQMSETVPLDYSLKSYLEVIFFDPRMKIYVQGALIRTRPLAKSLHKTVVNEGVIMGKPVRLILGRCQLEWEQANCGIFLYWHGRLIEAYKRVGSMIHNGDAGRGIIGVVDLTDLMKDDNGHIWVHNNKQGFQDCEAYAELEKWLAIKTDDYLDKYVNKLQVEKGGPLHKPDHEWVQCDKCRKWRRLSAGFNSKTLPPDWFCYMKPFNGSCSVPEEKVEDGVVTISTKRSGYNCTKDLENKDRSSKESPESGSDNSSQSWEGDYKSSVKRRKGLPRSCKKNPNHI